MIFFLKIQAVIQMTFFNINTITPRQRTLGVIFRVLSRLKEVQCTVKYVVNVL